MSEAFDKIMRGLVEAHKFCIEQEDYSAGIIIHQVQPDGTVEKISPNDFFDHSPPSSLTGDLEPCSLDDDAGKRPRNERNNHRSA